MFWGDINDIKRFTENTSHNKTKEAKKTVSVILAGVQLFENYIKGIKQLNAYDAASTIFSHANWIKNSSHGEFKDSNGHKITIKVGKIYYIDFGITFFGELSYYHYGLCIGKKENKILVIPITSGSNYFSTCYHPRNNPTASKKYRQGLASEGFQKDCVLKIDDTKFISAGRIIKECTNIHNDTLDEIQRQVFHITFPDLSRQYVDQKKKIEKLEEKNNYLKSEIECLKNKNNQMHQILKNNKLL